MERMVLGNDNPLYKVHIKCDARKIDMAVDMPETFTIAMQSEWEARFGGGQGPLDAVNAVARPIGGNVLLQEFTKQVWVSSSPIEIPIQLIFDAESSAYNDVYYPMKKLLELTVPWKNGPLLTAPGPDIHGDRFAVSVRVGKLLFIPDGIATSVQAQFDTRLDSSGFPIGGQIDMTIRTSQVYSNVEWEAATSAT